VHQTDYYILKKKPKIKIKMPSVNEREYDKLNPDIYQQDSWTF